MKYSIENISDLIDQSSKIIDDSKKLSKIVLQVIESITSSIEKGNIPTNILMK